MGDKTTWRGKVNIQHIKSHKQKDEKTTQAEETGEKKKEHSLPAAPVNVVSGRKFHSW